MAKSRLMGSTVALPTILRTLWRLTESRHRPDSAEGRYRQYLHLAAAFSNAATIQMPEQTKLYCVKLAQGSQLVLCRLMLRIWIRPGLRQS